ncbi:MAG: multicopper oxidase domain-containing protein [Lachnospiraceae bacterium]|nr:multicopper oxidase domain-containing protein [Lachnospiraceae bacterium]
MELCKYPSAEAVRNFQKEIPQPCEDVKPLVIRANLGDKVVIHFSHSLKKELSIHVQGLDYDIQTSDGADVGYNRNTTTKRQITYTWYAQREGVYLFHDMADPQSSEKGTNVHGLFGAIIVEAPRSRWLDPETGKELESGLFADIYHPHRPSFREYTVFFHDELEIRDKNGNPPRDPAPPILETYPGDEMLIRLLDGAHEEQHSFNLTGLQWKKEIENIFSNDVASQTLGISEAFNIRIAQKYGAGDYLYYFGGIDDAWLGLWGIIRVYPDLRKCLKPLCKREDRLLPLPPCPGNDSVIRKYEIAAIQKDICYNCHGDHDPDGLMFVPMEEMEAVVSGRKCPKPMILRANAGDWIEITLHNLFDPETPVPWSAYPKVPLDMKHRPSMRVSLNPQFLRYDPVRDSGINVGYNCQEQTVGPGESRKYLWYADKEYGACLIQSFGDLRNHRYHGLFGAVIIEPAGAKWYRNLSLSRGIYDEQAVITAPGTEIFREFVVFIQNGIRMLDAQGQLVKTAEEGENEPVDAEDTGEKGYNYRSERFANRLKKDRRISKIFCSRVHGDPATPVFRAYPEDRVIFRTMMPADKPRNVGFAIHGHEWKDQPADAHSRVISLRGAVSIGYKCKNICRRALECIYRK